MDEFLNNSGFPRRSMSLKHFRFTDSTLMNLFQKGIETKPAQITPIVQTFPLRRFVLVGDSGQEDPEVYAAMMRRFPDQIERVYIRNITQAAPTDARFSNVFMGIDPHKWRLFVDPATLELPAINER
jgi:phosphatidate phosphatase APP1